MSDLPNFAQYEKLAHKMAYRFKTRYSGGLRGLEQDDVYQEVCMAFLDATRGFKPELGFKFSTYFVRAATNRLQAISKSASRDVPTVSLDDVLDASVEEGDAHSVIADHDALLPGDTLEGRQMRDWMLGRMRPTTRLVVQLCYDPPAWLIKGAQDVTLRNLHGRSVGVFDRAFEQKVDIGFVLRFLGLKGRRREIVRELLRLKRVAKV